MPTNIMPTNKVAVQAKHVSKFYQSKDGSSVHALDDISVEISTGSVLAILGASGCGKSTLLRIFAGLDAAFSGEVDIDGAPVRGPGLDRGFVFQDHRLVPWMTVIENVELALHKKPAPQRREIALQKLGLVGLGAFMGAYPSQLSGGMAQRVAIARALAHAPMLLLLDEPFGALDALTRVQMQDEIVRIQAHEKLTSVLVTHDIEEALVLADKIMVLSSRPGRLQDVITVDFPKPRDRTLPEFANLRHEIYSRYFENDLH